jgi:hypothetical protein
MKNRLGRERMERTRRRRRVLITAGVMLGALLVGMGLAIVLGKGAALGWFGKALMIAVGSLLFARGLYLQLSARRIGQGAQKGENHQ